MYLNTSWSRQFFSPMFSNDLFLSYLIVITLFIDWHFWFTCWKVLRHIVQLLPTEKEKQLSQPREFLHISLQDSILLLFTYTWGFSLMSKETLCGQKTFKGGEKLKKVTCFSARCRVSGPAAETKPSELDSAKPSRPAERERKPDWENLGWNEKQLLTGTSSLTQSDMLAGSAGPG